MTYYHCKVNGEYRVLTLPEPFQGEWSDLREAIEEILGGKVEGAILQT